MLCIFQEMQIYFFGQLAFHNVSQEELAGKKSIGESGNLETSETNLEDFRKLELQFYVFTDMGASEITEIM